MRLSRLLSISVVVGAASAAMVVACGNSSPTHPDARVFKDGPPAPDAPAGLMGLGQQCGSGLPSCPTAVSACIGPQGAATGICTAVCDMNGSGTTNGSGQLLLTAITPPPNNTTCTGAFTGTVGTAACNLLLAITPADSPLMANKLYTGIQLDCGIVAGSGNACPGNLTFKNGFCF